MLLTELDTLSESVRTIINTDNNFARITSDNIVRTLYVLVNQSNYDKVQIAQEEIAIQLNLSRNRISELLNLAKKAGLITINMICRCGDIRNEYTLSDNPIIKSIKNIVFKSKPSDNKESILKAIDNAMNLYRLNGEEEHVLEATKRRMLEYDIKKASNVLGYFFKVLKTVKKMIAKPTEVPKPTYEKKKSKGSFNDYPQRPFDPTLEGKLLGNDQIEEIEDDEHTDTKAFMEYCKNNC